MEILVNLIIYTIAIALAAWVLPGVTVTGAGAAILTAIILGLINTFIKPILVLLTLPVNVLTLGLFTLVINALLIMLASAIVPGFQVDGFWWALLYAIILSILSAILFSVFS
jgi:putative membrane protein